MGDVNARRSRRRRSIRLHRRSSASFLPLYVPENNVEELESPSQNASATSSLLDRNSKDKDADTGGSFWLEVDDKFARKKRSRRASIGVHISKVSSDNKDDDYCAEENHYVLHQEQLMLNNYSEIEIAREVGPEALPSRKDFHFSVGESVRLNDSNQTTPIQTCDQTLPSVLTPSIMGGQDNFQNVSDGVLKAMETVEDRPKVECPPSCEEESDDSLLICTPDLSKLGKNIRFRCSFNFSELEDTPVTSNNSLNGSKDSIHESPVICYAYAADSHKKRSISTLSSSKKEPFSVRKHGVPKRLITAEMDEDKTRESSSNPELDTLTVPGHDVGTNAREQTKLFSSTVHSRSSSLTKSGQNSMQSSCSSSPSQQCRTSSEDDYFSMPSEQSSPFLSPLVPEEVGTNSTNEKNLCSSTDVLSDNQAVGECVRNVLHVGSLAPTTSEANTPTPENQRSSTDVPSDQLVIQHVENIFNVDNLVPLEEDPCPRPALPHSFVERVQKDSSQAESQHTVTSSECLKEVSPNSLISSASKSKSRNSIGRNIATDVCDMFRSLARRFSDGGKKKTSKLCRVKRGKKQNVLKKNAVIEKEKASPSFAPESEGLFTFRKEVKKIDADPEKASQAPDLLPSPSLSLDFGEFLTNTRANITDDPGATSPVLEQQSEADVNSLCVAENNCLNFDMENDPVLGDNQLVNDDRETSERSLKAKNKRPKRRSIEARILQQECEEFQESLQESEPTVRRSRRSRRSSIEIYRCGTQTLSEASDSPENLDSSGSDLQPKRLKGRKRGSTGKEENLENIYRNKNYKAPCERMWETIIESPAKTKYPETIQSKRRFRRSIAFGDAPPTKMKKRLQKAVSLGWDVSNKKRVNIPIEEVKNKIAALALEIE